MKKYLATIAIMMSLGGAAHAATTGTLQLEGGGVAQWYQLGNGNVLTLFGFDNREGQAPGAGDWAINSLADIASVFGSGSSRIVAAYNGSTPAFGGSEFDPFPYSQTVVDEARLVDALWLEWDGGSGLQIFKPGGGTSAVGLTDAGLRDGDPLAPIPLPAAGWLMIAGLGGLFAVSRRRKAA